VKNIRDIAKLAGVSHSTVSRVINGSESVKPKTREKIEKIMAEHGYKPNIYARGMLGSLEKTLGVVIPDVMDPFFSAMVSGIEQVCQSHNASMLIAESGLTEEGELEAIGLLLDRGCDAFIVQSKLLDDARLSELLVKHENMLLINRSIDGLESRCFYFDNYSGGRLAVEAVLAKGRKSIAIVSRSFAIEDAQQRYQGSVDCLRDAGLAFDDRLFVQSDASLQGGSIAGRMLLTTGLNFDAVVCFNDVMALGLMQVLNDNGVRSPVDVSVVGFNDLEVSRFSVPRLTTIHYPIEQMAQVAAMQALELSVDDERSLVWRPELMLRESH
jgi:LacI family transcriptional regulator